MEPTRPSPPRRSGTRSVPPTIVVVDDDEAVRAVLCELLEDVGYRVCAAEHGQAALTILRGLDGPSLVLLDLEMPIMNGYAFLEALRDDERLSRVPVVVTTAGRTVQVSASHLPIVWKPFHCDALLATIAAAIVEEADVRQQR